MNKYIAEFIGTFALTGIHDKKQLDSCKPYCTSDQIDAVKHKFLIADVFLGTGIVALAAAVWLYATSTPSGRPSAASALPLTF